MSTWVPGCLVTSADSSITVSPAPGGGSNISSVGSTQVDTSTYYSLPNATSLTANAGVNFFSGGAGAATTFTFLKGATYRIDAPFAVYVGASTVTAATTPALLVSPTVVVTGGLSYGLQANNLPLGVGSTGSTTAVPFSGLLTAVFTVGTGWGPAAGAAGYNPLTVTAVVTYKIVETALTTLALNALSGFGVSSTAYSPIVITRIK